MTWRSLDPPPTVVRGVVAFTANAARRTDAGIAAVVQVRATVPKAADTVLLSSSAARKAFGTQCAAAAELSAAEAEAALLELLADVEIALRVLPDDEPWATPVPLLAAALPAFPTHTLPDWLRVQVEGVAAAVQVPPDLPAMIALAGISLCVARRVVVCPSPSWQEPLNLYTMTVLASGNRKSATFAAMMTPFEAWEEAEKTRKAEAIALAQSRQRVLEAALHRIEAAAAKGALLNRVCGSVGESVLCRV